MKNQLQVYDTLLPSCASCKKVRDDNGMWHRIEEHMYTFLQASFTHTICPECASQLYPAIAERLFTESNTIAQEYGSYHQSVLHTD